MECIGNERKLLTGKKMGESLENYAKWEIPDTRLPIIYYYFMWNSIEDKTNRIPINVCQGPG